jgi:glutaredoxin 3
MKGMGSNNVSLLFSFTWCGLYIDHDIMVFAKSTCKYCKNSKKILDKVHKKSGMKGWNARFLYLDYMSTDGPKIHAALLARTGQKTVPNVFIGGKHVGGNTELTELFKSGELLKTIAGIAKAKATA